MSKQKVIDAALKVFSNAGYNGASLSLIAKEAGMKTPSLYAHVESKDDLFIQVVKDVMAREKYFAEEAIGKKRGMDQVSALFLFYTDPTARQEDRAFFARCLYFPPLHLKEEVVEILMEYERYTNETLLSAIREKKLLIPKEQWIHTFFSLMDGVFLEQRLYEEEELLIRRESALRTLLHFVKEEH
ncbi:hypothetical protein Q75_00990 [Bacillus coahuilensis p1.1.43]|uniref:HTH tetR-type domain-containing protein n=1 Tax=Bacillus coahuilensis p1.1.43 TaxID=1150625 RepID=A0A147KCF2_9BACI|nr:TetR/AcrR family transcriptional regulator [Bacillus coahuilensis]KUP09237.1 hypothetical protein Q75_00990 [Bacillus coahuilensis p1.1.43]